MRQRQLTPILLACLAAVALACVPAQAVMAEGKFERSLTVSGPVELDVTTGSGDITIRRGEAGRVHVVGTIRANAGIFGGDVQEKVRELEANPPIEQNGNSIRIGHITDPELRRNISISYEISAPAETRLHAQTGSGDQTVEGISGPIKAGSGSGHLRIEQATADVRANTGSGNLVLNTVSSSVYAHTGSGYIRATKLSGRLVAETGSGDVELEQSDLTDVAVNTGSGKVVARSVRGPVSIQTGSGDISVDGTDPGEWKLQAGSGTIRVRLPADAAFEFFAHTGSGSIRTQHPLTMTGSINKHELRGKVRGGGPLLQARTGSGDIYVE